MPARAAGSVGGDHLGHEAVGAALDALGAGDHRRALVEPRRQRARGLSQLLGGNREQHRVLRRKRVTDRRNGDAFVDADAGQPRAFAPLAQRLRAAAVARIKRDAAAGARDHVRQRRAPGAGADHGDALEHHGPTPEIVATLPARCPCPPPLAGAGWGGARQREAELMERRLVRPEAAPRP